MATGYLAFVLHAHLPFVRHPEHKRHLEERWFYEALIECYLPLLDAFDRMAEDGVSFALSMSVTPPLAAMLKDDLLRLRFESHLARLEELAEREMKRLYGDAQFAPIATFYRETLARVRGTWDRHRGDVIAGLVRHWDAGRLELLTCSATHCYLPGLLPAREGIRPQLELGVKGFESLVGRTPRGMWLPECAYHPAFDAEIASAGIRYTLVDTHGVENARPRPPFGVHAPISSPSGVVFFARDAESSRQVWSRDEGYPGNVFYRDFYRDIGFDLPETELHGEVGPKGTRLMTGLKYYRITGKSNQKEPYQPGIAKRLAWEDAGNFVFNRAAQMRHLAGNMSVAPIVVAPYDAELYGHWWFEGPEFLEAVFRQLPPYSLNLQISFAKQMRSIVRTITTNIISCSRSQMSLAAKVWSMASLRTMASEKKPSPMRRINSPSPICLLTNSPTRGTASIAARLDCTSLISQPLSKAHCFGYMRA
jgi:1,4-alpha-glucan branching enzyme